MRSSLARRLAFAGIVAVAAGLRLAAQEPADTRPLVVQVEIEGMVDGGLAAFVERTLETARAESAAAYLIVMNTYGGRVDAADEIRSDLLNTPIKTITFVHNNAASAGALIAMATDSIAMAPGSAIGAATPVDQAGHPGSSKVISYFRGLMGETARAKGRNPAIAEAMVDSTLVVTGLEDAPRPLTLRTDQAIAHGIAQFEAREVADVLARAGLGNARIMALEPNWSEDIVRFLTNPVVSGLLMTLGALGLIYELSAPGFGLPGIVGITCLALFFGSHWIVKLAELSEFLLFFAGIALIVAEIFVPGGILGIIGIVLALVGLFLSMIGDIDFVMPGDLSRAFTGVGIAVLLTFIGAVVILRSFAKFPIFRRLLLATRQTPDTGASATEIGARSDLVGREGIAETTLRPSGRAVIGGRSYDVMTDGESVEAGARVRVVTADAMRIVVREE